MYKRQIILTSNQKTVDALKTLENINDMNSKLVDLEIKLKYENPQLFRELALTREEYEKYKPKYKDPIEVRAYWSYKKGSMTKKEYIEFIKKRRGTIEDPNSGIKNPKDNSSQVAMSPDTPENAAAMLTDSLDRLSDYNKALLEIQKNKQDPTNLLATELDNLIDYDKNTIKMNVIKDLTIPNNLLKLLSLFATSQTFTDPLILDLDHDGIETISLNNSTAYYDLNRNGTAEHTAWVCGDDGLLVIDKNNNGIVDGINELFGNADTIGFEELKSYDTNNDLKINSTDTDFSKIKVWQDSDEDGVFDTGELKTLAELNINSINLNYEQVNENNNGNLISQTATFEYTDSTTGTIADTNFAVDLVNTTSGSTEVSLDVLELPVFKKAA